ncbi:MAG: uroporphyrinogen decarboxylase family protein [Thermofilaceae archaeon]
MGIIGRAAQLTRRERFLRVFTYRDVDRLPDVEFGYWSDTLRRWHREGLPEWVTDDYKADLYFGFENWFWNEVPYHIPFRGFKVEVLWEDERRRVVRDWLGVVKLEFKEGVGESIPTFLEYPVKDWDTWEAYKERFDLDAISYPGWEENVDRWRDRDYELGIHAGGFFGWARDLMGLKRLCSAILREPELVRDMFEFRTRMILRAIEKPVRELQLDFSHWWEDMCWNGGPLISPRHFRELMVPCYRRITEFLRDHGVRLNIIDCDGNIDLLIPHWLEAGINCFFPCEVRAGSDPVRLREKYGREALFMGGVDKRTLIEGPKAIEREIERLKPLMEEGGFIPHVDHRVPADVPYSHYLYYLKVKRRAIGLGAAASG